MSLSIIWKLSDDESRNLTTIQCLKEQIAGNEFETQILIYTKDKSKSAEYVTELSSGTVNVINDFSIFRGTKNSWLSIIP